MRIEEEIKLDYSDVLFRPKRSTLKSRKEVNLERTYRFKYSNNEWTGIPIIASNMDGVGELKVANSLAQYKILTALTKQQVLEKITKFHSIKDIFHYVALSCGTSDESYERLNSILKEHSYFQYICIDVANGYSENFSDFVSSVRAKYPSKKSVIAAKTNNPTAAHAAMAPGT